MTSIMIIAGIVVALVVEMIRFIRYARQRPQESLDSWPLIKEAVKIVAVFIAIGVAADVVAGFYTDYLWFSEVGYVSVWVMRTLLHWVLFLGGGVIAFVLSKLHIGAAWRAAPEPTPEAINEYEEQVRRSRYYDREPTNWRGLTILAFWAVRGALVVIVLLFAFYALFGWDDVIRYVFAVPFGVSDPIYGEDVSFYTFTLPVWEWLRGYFFLLFIAIAVVVGCLYAFLALRTEDVEGRERGNEVWGKAISHLCSLVGLLLLFWAWDLWLGRFRLLINGGSSRLVGAGYVDVNVRIENLTVLASMAAVIGGALFLFPRFFASWKRLGGVVVAVVAIAFVLLVVLPTLFQWFHVGPSELVYETPYIENHIELTRFAYGLGVADPQEFRYQPTLKPQEYKGNDATLSQARTMDWRPLLEANDTLQEIRTYYDFNDTDIDRYNGQPVMLGIRELNQDQLPDRAKTWSNLHLQYTHGEGFTVAEVSRVESQGLPAYIVKDIPPKGPKEFATERSEIYFGELTGNWIVTNTTLEEFGQPSGARAQYERYQGSAGIRLGTLERLALAVRMGDLQLLLSKFITADSKMIFRRTLGERMQAIAPMLRYDKDPYAVIGPDRVYWVWDAYTNSVYFPYSEPTEEVNYIRNSVKVVIDAYEGKTTFYVVDSNEPVVRVWMRAFPDLFRPLSEMPEFLRQHLRYPEDLFTIQVKKLVLFHMTDVTSFYNREDLWAIPQEAYQTDKAVPMDPRYVWMRLPGEKANEFVLILPFTPANKQNLVGWLGARMDGEHYGEMKLWLFPRDQTVIGPLQVEGLINQDPQMSKDISLWNQQGSKILWGNLIALPAFGSEAGTVVYVKPMFLLASQGKIPALTKVILYAGERLTIGDNLQDALTKLYSGSVQQSRDELIKEAQTRYEAAQKCAGSGDWVCFGREMSLLAEVLKRLGETK